MSNVAYSVGPKSLTIMRDGEAHMLDDTDARFTKIASLLRQEPPDVDEAIRMLDVETLVTAVSEGRVSITPDGVTFEGAPLDGYMAEKLVAIAGSGMNVTPWMRFMDNLMENPQGDLREDVFKWMEVGKLPITEDGCIVAFKKVRDNYTDVHTGKFSNTVGSVLEMPREQCDSNRHRTCSTGFHFCSADYLSHFGGQRVMIVKVDPRDVTAIPSDYNNSKGRCCRYEVTGELSSQSAARHKVFAEPVMPEDPSEIPDLLAKTPAKAAPRSRGPKSPIGTKNSSRKVAANAGQASKLKPAAKKETEPVKKAVKSTAKKAVKAVKKTTSKVASKVTKAVKAKPKTTTKSAKATVAKTKAPASKAAPKTKAPAKKPAAKSKTATLGKSTKTGTTIKAPVSKRPAAKKSTVAKAASKVKAKIEKAVEAVSEAVMPVVPPKKRAAPKAKAPAAKAAPKKKKGAPRSSKK
jgi:hypothetical protein